MKLNTKNLSRAAALILACAAPILAAGHIASDEAKSFEATEESIKADYSFTETSDDESVTQPAGSLSRPGSAITAYGNVDKASSCLLIPVNARHTFCPGQSDNESGVSTSVAPLTSAVVATPEPDGITLPLVAMLMLIVAVRRSSPERRSGC